MRKCPTCKKEHTRKKVTCGNKVCSEKYLRKKANMKRNNTIPDSARPEVSFKNRFLLAAKAG
jgi:hypothetical protein